MQYSSINVYLEEHDSCDSIQKQVITELKILPIRKEKRSYVVYTHDENEEIRLVEAFITNYKKELVYNVSALVDNELILNGDFEVELEYKVYDVTNGKQKNPHKKKHR